MNVSALFSHAGKKYAEKNYGEAAGAYELLLLKGGLGKKDKLGICGRLLECHAAANDYAKAYDFFRRIRASPELLAAHFLAALKTVNALGKPYAALTSGLSRIDAWRRAQILKEMHSVGLTEEGLKLAGMLEREFPEMKLFKADFLMKKGDYRGALDALSQARRAPPDAVCFRAAAAHFGLGEYKKAYSLIMRLGFDFEPCGPANIHLAPLELMAGFPWLGAMPFALACLAHSAMRGDYPDAERYGKRCHPEISNLFGIRAFHDGNYKKAAEYFSEALKAGERKDILFSLARSHFRNGDLGDAGRELKKAGFGARVEVLADRQILKRMGRGFPVFAGFEELEEVRGKDVMSCVFGNRGKMVYDIIDGRKTGEEVMDASGSSEADMLNMLGFAARNGILVMENRGKERLAPLFAKEGKWAKQLERVSFRYLRGHLGEAITALERVPECREKRNALGCIFYRKPDLRNAMENFARALSFDAAFVPALFNLGLCHAGLQNYAAAREDFSRVLELKPEFAGAYYLRGLTHEYAGESDNALKDYEKALGLDSEFSEARSHIEALKAKKSGVVERKEDELKVVEQGETPGIASSASTVRFSNLGGMHEVKRMLNTGIIIPLKNAGLAEKYSKKLRGGYILYGPPGCGKSYLAEAIAGEAGLALIRANIQDILNMYVGNSEKNLAAVFEEARKNQPALLFFDEIEALGGRRDYLDQKWQKTLVNVFLQEMDNIEKNDEKIVVFGATNAPWELDNALKRSGRFGKEIFVGPPDEKSRKEILEIYAKGLPLEEVDFEGLAQLAVDCSAANLKSICDRAANRAWEDAIGGNERKITMQDFLEAVKSEKSDVKEWMETAKMRGTLKTRSAEPETRMYG